MINSGRVITVIRVIRVIKGDKNQNSKGSPYRWPGGCREVEII